MFTYIENKTDVINQPIEEKIDPTSTSEYFIRLLGIYRYNIAKTINITTTGLIKRIRDHRVLKLFEKPKNTKIFLPIISPKIRRIKDKIIVKAKAIVANIDKPRTFHSDLRSC